MITQSVSEARRNLGRLIDRVRKGEDVVIIRDSKPVAALRAIDDSDLKLLPEVTDEQFQRLVEWDRRQAGKRFSSPEAAVEYLKKEFKKAKRSR